MCRLLADCRRSRAHRRLELAFSQGSEGDRLNVDVGVNQGGVVAGEIRHQLEGNKLADGALQGRARPAHQEGVAGCVFVIGVNAGIALDQRLEFEREGAIAGLDHEAAFVGRRSRVLLQCVGLFFFLDLELALEDADLLIQRFEVLLSRWRRGGGPMQNGYGYN